MDTELHNLILAVQQGNLNAFDEVVKRFQGMAYASAYAMLNDALLAEDVVQEAFIEAYTSLPKLREIDAFPGWFRRIIIKQGDRVLRRRHTMLLPLELAESEAGMSIQELDPAAIVVSKEQDELISRAIALLPEHECIVLLLFYGSGYAIKEIAAVLEVPPTTVKKRLYDGRNRLRARLMGTVRETLRQQQAQHSDYFSAKMRMLIAARIGDIDGIRAMLATDPTLVNVQVKRGEHLEHPHQPLPLLIGDTPLHETAAHHWLELAKLLLDYGAILEARTSAGETPLHCAVAANDEPMVMLLLDAGADINASLANGRTPLRLAAIKGHVQIVDLLLQRGAAVHTRGANGLTPLHWASLKGFPEIVSLLLMKGADICAKDDLGRIPLDWALHRAGQAVRQAKYAAVLRLLCEYSTLQEERIQPS
jgi:RNA polymerase sigma factor (sigma-70 family)